MVKISIAMATYNGGRFIREQLDSILNQTEQDFELIICDDCSTDDTYSIVSEYSRKDKRIKCFCNESNMGFKRNFEKAISLCTADYIALSDQDDVWLPDHLELLINNIGDKMVCCGDADLVDSEGKPMGMTLSCLQNLDRQIEDDLRKAYRIFFFIAPYQGASTMIRRDFFDLALPIPEQVHYHDAWFTALACFSGGIKYMKRPITNYRQHSNNVSVKKKKRISRLRVFIGHIRRKSVLQDRVVFVNEIRKRVAGLTDEQRRFLDEAEIYYSRKKTMLGRIANTLFELRHLHLIYGRRCY